MRTPPARKEGPIRLFSVRVHLISAIGRFGPKREDWRQVQKKAAANLAKGAGGFPRYVVRMRYAMDVFQVPSPVMVYSCPPIWRSFFFNAPKLTSL